MPILPLTHPEPLAATLGVMHYPGEDEESKSRARAYAAQFLATPLRWFHEAGYSLPYQDLLRIASDAGTPLDDIEDRSKEGIATGEIFKTLCALAQTDASLASWGNATKLYKTVTTKHRVSGSRSAFYAARSRYLAVAHLWGALCIRDRRFDSRPDVGYEGWHDFQFFLAEAETLRRWGQSWRPRRAKAKPPLPEHVWRVPDGWKPPQVQPGWPTREGRIPAMTIPRDLLDQLRRPGRQRKVD